MKLRCDAFSPTKPEDYDQSSDRGSIRFLLNGGTDSFTEKFRLPPRSDRTRGLAYHTKKEMEATTGPAVTYDLNRHYLSPFIEAETGDMSFFRDTFVNFMNGPFGDTCKALQDPLGESLVYPTILPPGPDPNLLLHGEQPFYEPESAFATALVSHIFSKVWIGTTDPKIQQEMLANLQFLLTTARIRKFVDMYFRYWHHNCPLLHPPSFDPNQVPTPLLASVVFMGAMYSNDDREVQLAKKLLDFAELYVFSTETFACESEIYRVFNGIPTIEGEKNNWLHFQYFQAGYLMLVVQYWAGSKASRNRAMEIRFSEIIRIARSLGLTKCRHSPEDRLHETLWIQKESRIRTINIISLLDCAFSFYQNYPCRLTHTEMECDLPCDESLYSADHPFAQPNFRFSREITTYEAFQFLFSEDYPMTSFDPSQNITNDPHFTVLDMFILIHLLYAFINAHMTLLVPYIRTRQSTSPSESSSPSDISRSAQPNAVFPEDYVMPAIRTSLTRWRALWMHLRTQVPSHEWASMGFFKNGYDFWLVAQLLITKKESVDVIMRMEVKCEDKLEKLKVLLQDDVD
ncbi:hypothetical protein Egran_04814 [Elaphomyces granulatus]|uniref:Xylanolytic transcriptional activator regulatory domain-containing protein n=1 Tax=Elaphomyces granulatus TaxID=519963 RepID=A0A232LTA5_9EURO|nr:hypothetical protein Egran_04814 [Elaphomyces granulatus]